MTSSDVAASLDPGVVQAERLRKQVVALVAVVTGADFAFGAVNVAHMTAANLSPSWIGLAIAGAGILSTFAQAPSGAIGDRFGQRRVLVIGLFTWGVGQLLFGLTDSPWTIAPALGLWGVGMAFYSGAPYALVVSALRSAGLEDRVSQTVRQTQVMRWTAASGGALAVFAFSSVLNPGLVIALGGALLVVMGGYVRMSWQETPRMGQGPVWATLRAGVRHLAVSEFRLVALLTAVGSSAFAVVVLAWQPMALEAGLKPAYFGLVLVVFTAASAIGAAASRYSEDRLLSSLIGGLMVLSLALCGAWFGATTGLSLLLVCEGMIGFTLTLTGIWSQEIFPDHLRNTLGSLMSVVGSIAMAVVDATFGLAWQAFGIGRAAAISGALLAAVIAVTGAVALANLHRRSRNQAPTT